MIDYPTRGFSLTMPTIVETQLTGWLATVHFQRAGADYDIRFVALRSPQCLRNGKPIDWHKMSAKARAVAHKAADWLNEAAKLRAA